MKKSLALILLGGGLGFFCAYGLFRSAPKEQPVPSPAEKSEPQLSTLSANTPGMVSVSKTNYVEVAQKKSPTEILARLKAMKIVADQPRSARLLGHELENLIACDVAALPVINDFLVSKADVDYDLAGFIKNVRNGKVPTEFNTPPSLRLGLFEAVKDIGGVEAEKILVDALTTTGRGLEVAFLSCGLEKLSPGKYQMIALQAAHDLLARPVTNASDSSERNFLFATLSFLNDTSFVAQAHTQLIQPDGKVDAAALKYLQQTSPKEALALALQSYQDPRITDANAKERLVQVALDSAGKDQAADNFFYAAMGDTSLPPDNRNNLAQDFADHGTNPKNPSAQDVLVMQKRLAMLRQLQGETTDPTVLAGILEGQKDLNKFIANYYTSHPQP